MYLKRLVLAIIFITISPFFVLSQNDAAKKPHRLIILSDIEAEVDDTESFVRLLLYANELKGLIATTSVWKRTSVAPEAIVKVINAYGRIY